ncbi:ABC transporter substrate-binding protein [Rhodococcus sp. ABRD24]|uniref:ABC transporter substrate-binding protein n=1 Tax=Rhodococcus sp. ABRD24 TaxID=2507582 RepID=UPI00103FCDF6|nr:ABC transporter substrate-binding protein [Rhodococcus sp. ABRD24]QBJ95738.1 ABC transporter substrate-binding protein [Rhodococcus sp. ABRD24]
MKFTRAAAQLTALLGAAAVVATGCSTAESTPTAHPSDGEGWSYTTGYGNTITLDAAPKRIVVDAYSAAALWDYGIRPAGIFGYGITGGQATGNADVSTMTIVGNDGEMNMEALADLDPDLVIGYGNSDDPTSWTWWDEPMADKVNTVAPFTAVKFSGVPLPDVLTEYRNLAEALGGDGDAAKADKAAFDANSDRIRKVAAERPDISLLPLNGDSSSLYTGTTKLAQLGYLSGLGVNFSGPDGDTGWADVSWEQVPSYPADIVMQYVRSHEAFAASPVFVRLPAVTAGQVIDWDDKRPNTYGNYAAWFAEVATAMENAREVA